MKDQLELARSIAYKAHDGQFRRDGITPYIEHPKTVAGIVLKAGLSPQNECTALAVAWLHDVLEDTEVTEDELQSLGVDPVIIDYVATLSKNEDEDYDDFIDRIINSNGSGSIPCIVKGSDILANLLDAPTENQVAKYTKALVRLF